MRTGSAVELTPARHWWPWVVATAVLLLLGAGYRAAMAWLSPMASKRIELPLPLTSLPVEVGGWVGEERRLTPEVERVADNDDYVSRLYRYATTGEAVNFYLAYSARPRTMLGHKPQVCYVGEGWVLDETQPDELRLASGEAIPCLVHHFHREEQKIVVLNYYILNGVPTNQEDRFAGLGWRLPNIAGDPAWYVAQVQVSGGSESAVRALAAATAAQVLDHLPDPEGKVAAAGASPAAKGP
jgi:EpsI family protein